MVYGYFDASQRRARLDGDQRATRDHAAAFATRLDHYRRETIEGGAERRAIRVGYLVITLAMIAAGLFLWFCT
jgi:hypothetical protein